MSQFDNAAVSAHLSHVRIVMVNTTLPANIGSALRAMKTMGLSKLVLVAPKTYPHPDIDALAAGATDLIEQIEIVETLADAIKDCHLVFGTSARSRTIPWPLLDARPAAEKSISAVVNDQQDVAVVFGREDRGLTNEELARIFQTSSDSVTKAKGRLKGRLGISPQEDLNVFLRDF